MSFGGGLHCTIIEEELMKETDTFWGGELGTIWKKKKDESNQIQTTNNYLPSWFVIALIWASGPGPTVYAATENWYS